MKTFALAHARNGFTLIELMIVVAIIAVSVNFALPSLSGHANAALLSNQKQSLFAMLHAGRGLAVSYGSPVAVCGSRDQQSCEQSAWSEGAIMFTDRNRNGRVDGQDELLRILRFDSAAVSIRGNRPKTLFLPDGTAAGTNQTITLCASGVGAAVVINNHGRVRFGTASC
jgi:type IV fimbrial biogenesis protein FimT